MTGGEFMYSGNYSNYKNIFSEEIARAMPNSNTPSSVFPLDDMSPPSSSNWHNELYNGSKAYTEMKFGRSQDLYDLQKSKSRATDIKKLIRSQCIYNSNVDPKSLKTNSDYINSLNKIGSSSNDTGDSAGLLLTKTYDEGTNNLINYLAETNGGRNLYHTEGSNTWYDGMNIMPFDISQEDNSPENDWKYAFNNLYYPLEDEYIQVSGGDPTKKIDSSTLGKGLLNFDKNKVTCVPRKNEEGGSYESECNGITNSINDSTTEEDKQKAYFKCVNKGSRENRHCKLKVNLDGVLLNTSDKFRAKILDSVSGNKADIGSDFFKKGDDFGDGLYGRWDSVYDLCGQQYTRCSGTIDNPRTKAQMGIGEDGDGENQCTNYFSQLKSDDPSIGSHDISKDNINSVSDESLCENAFLSTPPDDVPEVTSIGVRGGQTGCTYHAPPPDYYTDLNLVDKCSVDDLYEKLQSSGMRQVDLDKIEFTGGCPRRQIGYDLDFACSDKSGQFLSKSQTVEKCIAHQESMGTLTEILGGQKATDCVNPAVLKAFNELTDLDGGNPTKKDENTWKRHGDGPKTDAFGTGLLKILNGGGSTYKLEDGILKNECYWQPILKEKEYVDEDSSCILRCKDGAIQNGSQPYCKSAPDFDDNDSLYNVGYLNPYLNPEWDTNNFSCTAIEDKTCSPDNTTAGEGVKSVTRKWNESKQMYETQIQRCETDLTPETLANFFTLAKNGPQTSTDWVELGGWLLGVWILVAVVFGCLKRYTATNVTPYLHILGAGVLLPLYCLPAWLDFNLAYKKAHIWNILTIGVVVFYLIVDRVSDVESIEDGWVRWTIGILFFIGVLESIAVFVDNEPIKFDIRDESTLNEIEKNTFVTQFDGSDSNSLEINVKNKIKEYHWRYYTLYRQDVFFIGVVVSCLCAILLKLADITGAVPFVTLGFMLLSLLIIGFGGIEFNPTEIGPSGKKKLNIWGADPNSDFWWLSNPYLMYGSGSSSIQKFDTDTIPAHKCHQYSDCKYHDNCLWDEIVSIIDGPQDYIYNRTHELDPGYQMTELMYGFIYLINKYSECESTNTTSPCFKIKEGTAIDSWNTLFNPATPSGYLPTTGGDSNQNKPGSAYDTAIVVDTNKIKTWTESWHSDSGKKVLLDDSGNTILIRDLLKEYGISAKKSSEGADNTGETTLEKIFWYYWSYFYDGQSGKLREEVKHIARVDPTGSPDPTASPDVTYKIDETIAPDDPGRNLSSFYNKLLRIDSASSSPDRDDVRRCIPALRIIFKDWLYNNLKVPFNGNSDGKGKFSGCELNNKVCNYGVNGRTGECNESCENDELLDYSQGLCLNTNGTDVPSTDKYVNHMRHPALFESADGKHSLREYGPNFQRVYCEMIQSNDTDTDKDTLKRDNDKYYQKAGCIKNDFLNHNAIPGEGCDAYRERSESAGYNIDCNHPESRVHYQYYTSYGIVDIRSLTNKLCVSQFQGVPKTKVDDIRKVCGYDFDKSHLNDNYEWNDNNSIGVDVVSTVENLQSDKFQSRFKNTTGYEDISPILSCCEPKSKTTNHDNCLQGEWIEISDNKGYCSLRNTGFSLDKAREDLGMTNNGEVCNLFNLDSSTPGCERCANYTCSGSNELNPDVSSVVYSDSDDPELICCNGPPCSPPGLCQRSPDNVVEGDDGYISPSPCPAAVGGIHRCPTIPSIPPA